jgi:AcrR family transcriptional regulator
MTNVGAFRSDWYGRSVARTTTSRRNRSSTGGYAPEATRRALVDSALNLFGEKGYASTSVQEITEAAGVTKGAFYHHFESKEDLLRLIHDDFVDYYLSVLETVLEKNKASDPAGQLRELFRAFLPIVEQYQPSVTVFFQERRFLTGERFKAVKRKRDRFDALFRKVIEDGVASGSFRKDLDPRIVDLGILGMLSWVHQWYRPGGRYTAEQVADIFAELVLGGLRA